MELRFIAPLLLALASLPAHAQRVGTLISADPVAQAPAGMQAWRISYWIDDHFAGVNPLSDCGAI